MSTDERFDLRVAALLQEAAPPQVPEYASLIQANVRHSRQRAAWTFPTRWLPIDLQGLRPLPRPNPVWVLLAIVLLLVLGVATFIGTRPRLPAPIGLAANGEIAFDSGGRIQLTDGSGRTPTAITAGPGDSRVSFSPDGQHLAFLRQAGTTTSLMVANADGSNSSALVTVTRPQAGIGLEAPAWSPLSDRLAVTVVVNAAGVDHAEIWIVDATTGAQVVLLPSSLFGAQLPAWSPDGGRIAFLGEPTRRAEGFLYVANTDGSGLVRISERASSPATGFFGMPRWSPDGKQLATWYGDSAKLSGDILLLAADHLEESVLVATPKDESHPSWSPDGTRIAYWRSTTGYVWQVVIRDLDTGAEVASTLSGPTADTIVWAPDGEAVTVSRCDSSMCELLRLDAHDPSAEPRLVARLPPKSYDDSYDQAYWSWQRLAP